MSDIYETKYGVFNHIGTSHLRPLSSVAFHASEDINTDGLYENLCRVYIEKRIKEHYGLTIDEYLDRPRDIIEIMNRVADEVNAKHIKHAATVEAQFNNLRTS